MRTVLAVDDSISMRQLVGFALKKAGYTVVEAVDGRDALAKLVGAKVDLVITDLNMPNLDGIGLIKQIRTQAAYRFTPIPDAHDRVERRQEGRRASGGRHRLDRQAIRARTVPQSRQAGLPMKSPSDNRDVVQGARPDPLAGMPPEVRAQLRDGFVEEAATLIEDLETALLALEHQPENEETMNAAFRAAHTIKGSAAGFLSVADFTHHLEDTLDAIRRKERSLATDTLSAMLEGSISSERCWKQTSMGARGRIRAGAWVGSYATTT